MVEKNGCTYERLRERRRGREEGRKEKRRREETKAEEGTVKEYKGKK